MPQCLPKLSHSFGRFNRNVVIVIAFCLEPAYEPVLFLVGGRVPLMGRANNITITTTNLNNTRRTARMSKGTAVRTETLSMKSTVVLVADWAGCARRSGDVAL